ncbi:unnamed protein product [Ectocarpus sp. 12 AP-2014]
MSSEEEQERASENKYLSVTKLSREQVWVRELSIHSSSTAVDYIVHHAKKDTWSNLFLPSKTKMLLC